MEVKCLEPSPNDLKEKFMIGLAFNDKQKENEEVVPDPTFSVSNNELKLATENFEIPPPPSPKQRKQYTHDGSVCLQFQHFKLITILFMFLKLDSFFFFSTDFVSFWCCFLKVSSVEFAKYCQEMKNNLDYLKANQEKLLEELSSMRSFFSSQFSFLGNMILEISKKLYNCPDEAKQSVEEDIDAVVQLACQYGLGNTPQVNNY